MSVARAAARLALIDLRRRLSPTGEMLRLFREGLYAECLGLVLRLRRRMVTVRFRGGRA